MNDKKFNDCQFCGVMAGCLHLTECPIWQKANPNNPANLKCYWCHNKEYCVCDEHIQTNDDEEFGDKK